MNSAGAILNVEQIVAGRYLDLALLILMWVGAILVMNALKRGWTLK
ncbi:MAG: hypothetical protein QXP13_02995 [Candidatus Methanomethylicia archaeon]